jgi:pimeloyl-ACP methyl ester carboxylesterase
MITGGGGTQLHLVETGNPAGQSILFLHGFSQNSLIWNRQLHSELADRFRLIAMDLRGHGLSDKPREAYADTRLWADDVQAAITTLGLERPILCGWSYGPLVILDYLRHYGEDQIRAVNFIGGVTKLGSEEAASVLSPEFLGLIPGFFSADAEANARSLDALLRLCFAEELAPEHRAKMLEAALSVPPHVRQGLFGRSVDNDDILPKLRKPALITHGSADAVVAPAVIERQMMRIASAKIHMMSTGHACFWDDAAGYNQRLLDFAVGL